MRESVCSCGKGARKLPVVATGQTETEMIPIDIVAEIAGILGYSVNGLTKKGLAYRRRSSDDKIRERDANRSRDLD